MKTQTHKGWNTNDKIGRAEELKEKRKLEREKKRLEEGNRTRRISFWFKRC